MPFTKIVLHVGLHKTGTTSIQTNCHRHRAAFAEHGIIYPSFVFGKEHRGNHSAPLAQLVVDDPDEYGKDWRTNHDADGFTIQQAYREQFSELFSNAKGETLILSGEKVSGFEAQHLRALQSILLEHTDQLQTIVYVRDPLTSVTSIVQQQIKAGFKGNLGRLVGRSRKRVETLLSVFGDELTIVNFHEAVSNPAGLVNDFLHRVGLSPDTEHGLDFVSANSGISLEASLILQAINIDFPAGSEYRKKTDAMPLLDLPGAKFELKHFRSRPKYPELLAERAWFEEELGMTFPEIPPPKPPSELWGTDTLFLLEDRIRRLTYRPQQFSAANFLIREAEQLSQTRPDVAWVLFFIGTRILAIDLDPRLRLLNEVGQDHFIDSAAAIEESDPELALNLLLLARQIEPVPETIINKIQYLNRLTTDTSEGN